MSTTTATKKELVDFLWEWADTQGQWAKLLVDKVVTGEKSLSKAERAEVFNYFLESLELKDGLPSIQTVKPAYAPHSKHLELSSLSKVQGVNKLAKNQTLIFSEHLTVIYGENGAGKTGYGRILKALGISYDLQNKILPNIFGTSEAQSATIDYTLDKTAGTFVWNGANAQQDLKSISVFNNNCVQISLNSKRGLIVSPIGFHLFQLVSTELNELESLFYQEIEKYPTQLIWQSILNLGTPQAILINGLSKFSTEAQVQAVATFTDEHAEALSEREQELRNLNKTLLETEIALFQTQIAELDSVLSKVSKAQEVLTNENWQALVEYNRRIKALEGTTQIGLKDIAEANGIKFYQSNEFQAFIVHAEEYIKKIGMETYPNNEGDTCIYCQQQLDAKSKELLQTYRALLNDSTQATAKKLKMEKSTLANRMIQPETTLTLHHPSFGKREDASAIQPEIMVEYSKTLKQYKELIKTDAIEDGSNLVYDFDGLRKILNEKRDDLFQKYTIRSTDLTNLTTKENELQQKIRELKDRKFLSGKASEIMTAIKNFGIVAKLNSKEKSFDTGKISRKTTEAREQLIAKDFQQIFDKELKILRKSQIAVEISFGTDKGQSQVQQKMRSHNLSDILSEGEQKAIALAEFLTELQLDNGKAPVIFDDPVNSLDHKIIDDYARRVINLSLSRQTIIFTHSILLFNSIIQQAQLDANKKLGLKTKFHNVTATSSSSGVIEDAMELNSISNLEGKINTILNNSKAGASEADLAADGYGQLRAAIELLVEKEILQDTIKRYRRNVALTSFLKINGQRLDQHKTELNEIFERCSGYLSGHSNPEEIHNSPTLAELKTDFDAYKKIRADIIKKEN